MIKQPRWTPDHDERLKVMRADGLSVEQISGRIGFSRSWIEQRITKLGLGRKKAPNGQRKQRPSRAKAVPVGPAADPRPAYVPAGLETQGCRGYLGYDVRFQCAPDTRVLGGFSTAGIGRDLNGQPWEAWA